MVRKRLSFVLEYVWHLKVSVKAPSFSWPEMFLCSTSYQYHYKHSISLTIFKTQSWTVVSGLRDWSPVTPLSDMTIKTTNMLCEGGVTCFVEMSRCYVAFNMYKCERISGCWIFISSVYFWYNPIDHWQFLYSATSRLTVVALNDMPWQLMDELKCNLVQTLFENLGDFTAYNLIFWSKSTLMTTRNDAKNV